MKSCQWIFSWEKSCCTESCKVFNVFLTNNNRGSIQIQSYSDHSWLSGFNPTSLQVAQFRLVFNLADLKLSWLLFFSCFEIKNLLLKCTQSSQSSELSVNPLQHFQQTRIIVQLTSPSHSIIHAIYNLPKYYDNCACRSYTRMSSFWAPQL